MMIVIAIATTIATPAITIVITIVKIVIACLNDIYNNDNPTNIIITL